MNKLVAAAAAAGISFNSAHSAPLPEARADDVGVSKQRLAKLDEFFASEIAAKRVPGAVVAIAGAAAATILATQSVASGSLIAEALLAALIVGVLSAYGTLFFPVFELFFIFVIMAVVLLVRPQGLFAR